MSRGTFLRFFALSLITFSQMAEAQNCDARMLPSQDKRFLTIAGPRIGKVGAIWYYKTFEKGRLYRFCADLPQLNIGRDPSYREHRDNIVVETLPPPNSGGADIYFAVIDPMGRKYTETQEHYSSRRILYLKYRQTGTWIVEMMVRDGETQHGIWLTEVYGGFKIKNGLNFLRLE